MFWYCVSTFFLRFADGGCKRLICKVMMGLCGSGVGETIGYLFWQDCLIEIVFVLGYFRLLFEQICTLKGQ